MSSSSLRAIETELKRCTDELLHLKSNGDRASEDPELRALEAELFGDSGPESQSIQGNSCS